MLSFCLYSHLYIFLGKVSIEVLCRLVAKWYLTLLWPHGLYSTRLPCPWDFTDKNRVLEWVAISFSRGSFCPRDWNCVFCIAGGLYLCTTREAHSGPLPIVSLGFCVFFAIELYVFFIHFEYQHLFRYIICNYFPLTSYLFILFLGPVAVQKLFSLMESHLFILDIVICALGVQGKNYC